MTLEEAGEIADLITGSKVEDFAPSGLTEQRTLYPGADALGYSDTRPFGALRLILPLSSIVHRVASSLRSSQRQIEYCHCERSEASASSCFVAPLLAKTNRVLSLRAKRSKCIELLRRSAPRKDKSSIVIASEAKQEHRVASSLRSSQRQIEYCHCERSEARASSCFVAPLLARTNRVLSLRAKRSKSIKDYRITTVLPLYYHCITTILPTYNHHFPFFPIILYANSRFALA